MVGIGPRRFNSPTTDFYAYADVIGQEPNANYSVIRLTTQAINRGNTSSFFGNAGAMSSSIDDLGINHVHSGNPFLPSGVGTNVQRWSDYEDYVIYHGADGFINGRSDFGVRLGVNYGSNQSNDGTTITIPRIPKPPISSPTGLSVDSNTSTSLRYVFTFNGDDGGTGITSYTTQAATDAGFSNVVKTVSTGGSPATLTGLAPSTTHYIRSQAVNARGGGAWSTAITGKTLGGVKVPVSGTWTEAQVLVGINGVWVPCDVQVGVDGVWKGLTA
ncbi:MAG: fibronectin type III domain-containing protein [Rhodospirillales bacterium]|nr:fibronectin type III domain-containing protein [Acetobacter sp.]